MQSILLKSARRIRAEVPKAKQELLAKCDELVGLLASLPITTTATPETDADKYFPYLQAACESGEAKVMELSLDGIHTLIEYGYLQGKKPLVAQNATSATATEVITSSSCVDHSNSADLVVNAGAAINMATRNLIDLIIEVVCKCSDEFNDGVQLQVIKVLLTAVTSLQCEVNESSLLLAIRACFHIHLISKNPINKVTTKAALTQMVNAVNAKMEASDVRLKANSSSVLLNTFESSPRAEASTIEVVSSFADAVSQQLATSASAVPFASVQHKDSFLLFRALCKLSMKGLHDDARESSQADAVAMQNK